jgi:ribosomal protein S18 acetylase RimI-like enzyme
LVGLQGAWETTHHGKAANPRHSGGALAMGITYFKRFKMEVDLRQHLPMAQLPPGYHWVAWDDAVLDLHADVQYRSFCEELDSTLFPSLGDRYGSRFLMNEIRQKPGFLPEATWLVATDLSPLPPSPSRRGGLGGEVDCCGTVQGVCDQHGWGAIQNLGVMPLHRGRGLGSALLLRALHGFRFYHIDRAYLEVTAENERAVRLYRRLGFRKMKTLYKAVDV